MSERRNDGKALYDELNFDAEQPPPAGATGPTADADQAQSEPESGAAADFTCASCSVAITAEYYTFNQNALCPNCHGSAQQQLAAGSGSVGQALWFGALTAAAGAALYYGISAITGYELGIIAIVIGIGVGKAVRKGAGTRAHWVYRALAIGLTWMSIVGTYIPQILEGMEQQATSIVALVVAGAFAMVAPFFLLIDGEFMAVIILGIGLWEGWRYSAPAVPQVEGPFRVGEADPATTADAIT